MALELRHLRYFRHLARAMNFGAAADQAGISQSSLSEQITRLEDLIGTPLVDRSRRRIRLTMAGELLRDEIDGQLAQFDAMIARVRGAGGSARPVARVGYSEMAIGSPMPTILHLFRERHPTIDLTLTKQSSIGAERALRDGTFDCLFIPGEHIASGIAGCTLARQRILLCLPSSSSLLGASRLTTDLLDDMPLILPEEGSQLSRFIERQFAQAKLVPTIIARAASALSMMTLVASEQGAAFIPESLSGLQPPGVVTRAMDGADWCIPFSLFWLQTNKAPALAALVEVTEPFAFQREGLRDRPETGA